MKYLKKFRLFEAGEWSRGIDWEYAKENPDDDSEEVMYINAMEKNLNTIKSIIENTEKLEKIKFEIIDIRGFDLYTGAYGTIKVNNKIWKIWNSDYNSLWIEDFPINNSPPENNPGFEGDVYEIAKVIIEYYDPTKKYNI